MAADEVRTAEAKPADMTGMNLFKQAGCSTAPAGSLESFRLLGIYLRLRWLRSQLFPANSPVPIAAGREWSAECSTAHMTACVARPVL